MVYMYKAVQITTTNWLKIALTCPYNDNRKHHEVPPFYDLSKW
jgi:hypothetical protein